MQTSLLLGWKVEFSSLKPNPIPWKCQAKPVLSQNENTTATETPGADVFLFRHMPPPFFWLKTLPFVQIWSNPQWGCKGQQCGGEEVEKCKSPFNPLLGGGGKGLCRLKKEAGFITSAKIPLTINSGENPGYRGSSESQKEGKHGPQHSCPPKGMDMAPHRAGQNWENEWHFEIFLAFFFLPLIFLCYSIIIVSICSYFYS